VISRRFRFWFGRSLSYLAGVLAGAGLTPAMLSLVGVILALGAGWVFAQNRMLIGGVLVLVSGGLDGLDGEVARITSSPKFRQLKAISAHLDWRIKQKGWASLATFDS
jgi:CDP-alcohol phosphatidyltransferase